MKNVKTHCIVLKSSVVREIDKSVTLISPDIGIFTVTAFGACKSRNRFGGKLEPFSVLSAELTVRMRATEEERQFKELTLLDSFENLTKSYETVLTAQFFCEVLLKNNTAGEDRRMFSLLYHALKALNRCGAKESETAVVINFLVRYLAFAGFFAPLSECSLCGRAFQENETVFMQRQDHQPYCAGCVCGGSVPLESELRDYLNTVLKIPFAETSEIPINTDGGRKLKVYLISLLKELSGFRYKTLESLR